MNVFDLYANGRMVDIKVFSLLVSVFLIFSLAMGFLTWKKERRLISALLLFIIGYVFVFDVALRVLGILASLISSPGGAVMVFLMVLSAGCIMLFFLIQHFFLKLQIKGQQQIIAVLLQPIFILATFFVLTFSDL
ncbi:hypothetical protein N6H14_05805 [Paenibacillus sp. CC-CFT747]|nr:hypothetical protein N6H14_05805 [Paenibacillus sp. CC-CFT747]